VPLPLNSNLTKRQDDNKTPRNLGELRLPKRGNAVRELRTIIDIARMALPLFLPVGKARAQRKRHIIVLPGFSAGDQVTWPLRRYLRKLGHHAEGWGLGVNRAGIEVPHQLSDLSPGWQVDPPTNPYRNEGSVPLLCDRMTARVKARHAALNTPITLIGWSLGGVIAREVARDLPDVVEQVITLGTPVQGGPKYTAAAAFFRKRGMDLDWIERETAKRESRPIRVPITAIISPSDGVVGRAAAYDHYSPNVRHVEIDAAHLGLCFNPSVWRLITEALNGAT
jgi:pimeloyl-ACP methyl ester carboxylesterase